MCLCCELPVSVFSNFLFFLLNTVLSQAKGCRKEEDWWHTSCVGQNQKQTLWDDCIERTSWCSECQNSSSGTWLLPQQQFLLFCNSRLDNMLVLISPNTATWKSKVFPHHSCCGGDIVDEGCTHPSVSWQCFIVFWWMIMAHWILFWNKLCGSEM